MFEELVARQDSVVSQAQDVAHGYSADRVQRRVREGRWRRLHPGVVLVGGHRLTDDARVRAGIAGWVLGHWCGPYAIDITFPRAKLAIEVDGWAWHVDQDSFANDRRKGNALVRAGWTVPRLTWHDVTQAPPAVLAQIAAAPATAA